MKVYECTGFGELCCRFEACGAREYSPELADVVVREVWAISSAVRSRRGSGRRCVVARHCWTCSTGRVGRPFAVAAAERVAVTADAGATGRSRQPVRPGVGGAWEVAGAGLSAKTLQHNRYDGFDPIVRAHQEQGLTRYSAAVTAGLVDQTDQRKKTHGASVRRRRLRPLSRRPRATAYSRRKAGWR